MQEKRTENSIKNIKYALIGQFFGIVISLISRIFFVKILSEEYLGLNGLFSNILTILSLTEMGFGTAMCCQLYEPLAKQNVEAIKSLMNLYKKIYNIITLVIIILGILTVPIYPYLINTKPDIKYLNIIYLMFVINTALTYFMSYKRLLIISDQKRYIATFYRYLCYFVLNVVQIVILYFTRNYILFLLIQTIITIIENYLISIRADKIYPYLKEKNIKEVSLEEKNSIKKNVKAMFFHKFGGTVLNSTDSIVISKFVGLAAVGLYSNYYLITNALTLVISQIYNSLVASIGNLKVNSNREKMTDIFDKVFFFNYWLHLFCTICLLCLLNPFIKLWLGDKFTFDFLTVIIISINFYIFGMRRPAMVFREATGNYYNDRYSPVVEAAINIISSIIFAHFFGVGGVFAGTILSCLCTCFWLEPLVVCKKSLNKTLKNYFKTYFSYTILGIIITLLTFILNSFVLIDNAFYCFIIKLLISVLVPNFILILVFRKNSHFLYYLNMLKEIFRKVIKKRG